MDTKSMALALGAALTFAVGGLFMKPSEGLSRLWPSCVMIAMFGVGAVLNALVVHRGGELGVAYLLVVGCETLLAFGLGVMVYHEKVTPTRLLAMTLVAAGALLLATSERSTSSVDVGPDSIALAVAEQ
jgi:multidrug transporter EmrE-like cation transporter